MPHVAVGAAGDEAAFGGIGRVVEAAYAERDAGPHHQQEGRDLQADGHRTVTEEASRVDQADQGKDQHDEDRRGEEPGIPLDEGSRHGYNATPGSSIVAEPR